MIMPANKKKTLILIVDDTPDTLSILNESLDQAGMSTLVALDGKQALRSAQSITPDLILLDAIMPILDGFETCRLIKEDPNLKNIPIIFMTGLSDTESIVKGFESGGTDYLTKPINTAELIARIHTHLHNSRESASVRGALDITGQSIFVTDNVGNKLWETPCVEKLLEELKSHNLLNEFEKEVKYWLARNPEQGNNFHFFHDNIHYTGSYIGMTKNLEHHIKLTNNDSTNDASLLQEKFLITKRESDVFLWLAHGKTNREIAQILDMKPRTVNKHLENIFKKLDVDNRTSAAGLAIQFLQAK